MLMMNFRSVVGSDSDVMVVTLVEDMINGLRQNLCKSSELGAGLF